MAPKGLTITSIFDAMSLNYGEGIGNISELKKVSKGGQSYSYMSRQAIRYEIYRMLKELFNIDDKEDPLTAQNGVIQFSSEANIEDYIEVDLFGYMKTKKNKNKKKTKNEEKGAEQDKEKDAEKGKEEKTLTRPAVIRIAPAIAMEPMNLDIEFGTNLNFAQRAGASPNPFQFEHQSSLYTYTVTIELNRVGIDENDKKDLDPKEKARRVNMLLEVLKFLNRNIKGRMENLNPLFAIGGVYDIKNPFFLGRLKVNYSKKSGKPVIERRILSSILDNTTFNGKFIKEDTYIGLIEGYFDDENEKELKNLLPEKQILNVNKFFETLKQKVNEYYGVSGK